ncbi:MAG TPA: beta-ribofuranosylaminobenzene 5'-phosphate synthase family protein [Gemmatimonadaceae bacterium]|nr:beta-ribofuranosylaminobenzene 5'-phosphate synthase family protein [Gemmatimonadaceae bacterium]
MTLQSITIETPARLHFGLLDLRTSSARRFGGIGAPAPGFSTRLTVSLAPTVSTDGDDGNRAAEFARRFLDHYRLPGGAAISVERVIPAHSGLGSGTQLALAVALALAELHGVTATAAELARAVGRARRSAVGTWTFAGGGFVVEGGQRSGDAGASPLIARITFPSDWRCVVAIPDARPGLNSDAESAAFAQLPEPAASDVERVAYLVLLGMLPALAENDVAAFGAALTEIQEINGRWFSHAQGGTFAPGASADLVAAMREWGAAGVGQSSWGPAVYAIVDGDNAAQRLAARVRGSLGAGGVVHAGPFPDSGARIAR